MEGLEEYGRFSDTEQEDRKPYRYALFIDEARSKTLNRFLLFIERGDYGRALRTLEQMEPLAVTNGERASHLIISRLIGVLNEYADRSELLRDNDPFDEIKLSYLNEDYGKTRRKVEELKRRSFLAPLLTGIDEAAFGNAETLRRLDETVALRGSVRTLARNADALERKGEYLKAAEVYEDILIFQLPTYDREYILNRIHKLWVDVELNRLKREENTKAIKYLESARILSREENEREALKYYKMLLLECPHSDFISQAVDEITNLFDAD
jgi:hypothetical protein